jgi:hypothetical protein
MIKKLILGIFISQIFILSVQSQDIPEKGLLIGVLLATKLTFQNLIMF